MDKFEIFNHLTSSLQYIGEKGDFEVTTEGNKMIITGYPSSVFNLIVLSIDNDDIEQLKDRRVPFICIPTKELVTNFEDIMIKHNLEKADEAVANIFNDLSNWNYSPSPIIEIRPIMEEEELHQFDKISAQSYMHSEGLAYNFLKSVIPSSNIYAFIAHVKDKAVGVGMVSFIDNKAGLYWGCVLPEYRNQGIGTELTKFRMDFAKNKGFKAVFAQNLTLSQGYYKKIGFKSQGKLPIYLFQLNL